MLTADKNLYSLKQRKDEFQFHNFSSQLHHFCENDQIEFSPKSENSVKKSEWKVKTYEKATSFTEKCIISW